MSRGEAGAVVPNPPAVVASRRGVLRPVGAGALGISLVVGAWQFVYLSGWKPKFVLPGPATVAANLWEQARHPLLWEAVGTTLGRAAHGFGCAVLAGLLLGIAFLRNRILRAALGPVIMGLQTMPAIAWFPFAIIFFGLTRSAILFVIVIGAAPSIAIAVMSGADHIPPQLLRAAKSIGLHGISLYRHLILPASLPAFVVGLKHAWAFAWRSLMAGELVVIVADAPSIGVLLENAQNLSDMPSAIAIMIVILVIGIVIDALLTVLDRVIRQRWGLLDRADS
ncbi:ABC transporter permease [Mycobacterium avium subsp. hominissuis]|nr:ABC transporter permease [Mycobacterium avium subsp. hominissuis]MDV3274675.1 ABC transporter permease [Mycobacterium avium subsp. hominissuis]MDV3322281.1 ABC transporter permease [Mycobacterium avium subsp. hominissuis]